MLRPTALLLLLCACVARPADDDPADTDDPGDETTAGDLTTAADGSSSGPTTTSATTNGTTVASATATITTGEPPVPSFEVDIQPIFDEHCLTACHEPDGEWGFLLDLSGGAYESIVGVPAPELASLSLVEPGEPGASYLWHKINGTQADVGGSGLMMPKPRAGMESTVLTPDQLAAIEQWILQGAPP